MQSAQGFTLIELIVTVALIAIVSTLAIPAWQNSVQRGQVENDARVFSQALTLARSEAVTRGVQASVCPLSITAPTTECGEDWQSGWVVYLGSAGTLQADKRLRVHQGSKIQKISGGASRVTFNPRGMLDSGNATWGLCSGKHGVNIVLAKSGRIGKVAGGNCE